jgi:hypothetical protein
MAAATQMAVLTPRASLMLLLMLLLIPASISAMAKCGCPTFQPRQPVALVESSMTPQPPACPWPLPAALPDNGASGGEGSSVPSDPSVRARVRWMERVD